VVCKQTNTLQPNERIGKDTTKKERQVEGREERETQEKRTDTHTDEREEERHNKRTHTDKQ
jgi:hypothetical protein